MERKRKRESRITAYQLCMLAMAVCLNVAGSQISLVLRLPIYMDSIGSVLAGAMLGPVWGAVPSLVSSILMGMTTDIYALYFAPSGILVGMITGILAQKQLLRRLPRVVSAFIIAFPGIAISAVICANVFNGVTSSGSTLLVQLLARTSLGMTGSAFVVQFVTEYPDRLIGLCLVLYFLNVLPEDVRQKWQRKTKGGMFYGNTGK